MPDYQEPTSTPAAAASENYAQICLEELPSKVQNAHWYEHPLGTKVDCIEVVRFKPKELNPQIISRLESHRGKDHKLESLADFMEDVGELGYSVSRKLIGKGFDFDLRITFDYSWGLSPYNCKLWLVLPPSKQERAVLAARLVVNRMSARIKDPAGKFRKYPFSGLNCIEVVQFRREELTAQTINRLVWARRENLNQLKSLADFLEAKRDQAYFVSRELLSRGCEHRELRITLEVPVCGRDYCTLWLVLPTLR